MGVGHHLGLLILISITIALDLGIGDEKELLGGEVQILDWEMVLEVTVLEVSIVGSFDTSIVSYVFTKSVSANIIKILLFMPTKYGHPSSLPSMYMMPC